MWQSIEETSFFNEIEDISDEVAHISRKRAYEIKVGIPGFSFRYQKSTLQCPRKPVSRRVSTLLVNMKLNIRGRAFGVCDTSKKLHKKGITHHRLIRGIKYRSWIDPEYCWISHPLKVKQPVSNELTNLSVTF